MPKASKQKFKESIPDVYPDSQAEFRQWLSLHYATSTGAWLVLNKKSGSLTQRLSYDAAVEELLCFGWIDSVPQKIDADTFKLMITPRKKGSVWSALNKTRIDKLIANGLMTDAGMRAIQAAQADGSWAALDAIDQLLIPPDLAAALDEFPLAKANFSAFSPSAQKQTLQLLAAAKRPETRTQRIRQIIDAALLNRKVYEVPKQPKA